MQLRKATAAAWMQMGRIKVGNDLGFFRDV